MTPAIVLQALLALAPAHADRADPPEARAALLAPVAEAISFAARTPHEAALLIAVGYHESTFQRAVVAHGCEGLEPTACDSRRARGSWQLHRAACPLAWLMPVGSPESLRAEALCAIRLLRFGGARCRDGLRGAVSIFATGNSCSWSGAAARVETMARVANSLRVAAAAGQVGGAR